jgi:hypothetical protein
MMIGPVSEQVVWCNDADLPSNNYGWAGTLNGSRLAANQGSYGENQPHLFLGVVVVAVL